MSNKKIKSDASKPSSKIPSSQKKKEKTFQKVTTSSEKTQKRDSAKPREKSYGPFVAKEIASTVVEVGKKDLQPQEIDTFLSTSTSFRELAGDIQKKRRVVLTCSELLDSKNEKLHFARDNNLMMHLKFDDLSILDKMALFINKPKAHNLNLLKNIEAFTFTVNLNNPMLERKIMDLIELLNFCPNLISLKCQNFDNITLKFALPDKLRSFFCQTISNFSHITIESALNLTSFSCEAITDNSEVLFENTPSLISFTCITIDEESSLTFDDTPELQAFSNEKISSGSELFISHAPKLKSISCSNIQAGASLILPNKLPNLQQLDVKTDDPDIQEMLADLEKEIPKSKPEPQS